MDYSTIPKDCLTNNYLENYNGFIKSKLGKKRVINWINFINFIKEESGRSIKKLYGNEIYTFTNNDKINLENKEKKEEIINLLEFENTNIFSIPYNLEDAPIKKLE